MSAPFSDSSSQHVASGLKDKPFANIDDADEVRMANRLVFTPEEDVRLASKIMASAWLYNSNDPINGNGKKNDSYWADVLAMYNSTIPTSRKREVKHLKDHWQKIKRWVGFFCGSWKKASSIYASGQSDDQLRDKAMQFYLDDYKEGPFTVMHCWKVLCDEPKWHAVLDDHEKPNKRKLDDEGMAVPDATGEKKRPIGTKEANRKDNVKSDYTCLNEDMKKYADIQAVAKKRHEEFLETQQRVSNAKVETTRLLAGII
uniref:No apical meristem-associated C-terminal domain-containing protein n=1 Tax=Arundo donax TaxID=35708 RepID=A0A0A8YN59_ARUDO